MINELILMNGYGPFVWSAFIFTGISFVSLYLIIKLQLEKETTAGSITLPTDATTTVQGNQVKYSLASYLDKQCHSRRGSSEQHKKYIKLLASGKMIGAWALTEPNTGSDSGKMASTAVKKGNKWILNGTKNFITHGKSGDLAVAIFRTGPVGEKNNSTAFIIERGNIGLSSGKKENKLGMRASETAEMIFSDCIIDDSNRLGEVGDGFKQSMKILDGGRISIAALSLGIANGAYKSALKYSQERVQFGKSISSFQAISFKLAEMATEIQASELLT